MVSIELLPLRLQFLNSAEAEPLLELLEKEGIPYEAKTPALGFDPFFAGRPYEPRFEVLIQPSFIELVRSRCEEESIYTGLLNTSSRLIQTDEEIAKPEAHQLPVWLFWIFFIISLVFPVVAIGLGVLLLSRRFIQLEAATLRRQRNAGILLIVWGTVLFFALMLTDHPELPWPY